MSKEFYPEVRPAQREAFCRACGGVIPKGSTMVSWYSYANRGMHIHLHTDCVKKMTELLKTEGEVENET